MILTSPKEQVQAQALTSQLELTLSLLIQERQIDEQLAEAEQLAKLLRKVIQSDRVNKQTKERAIAALAATAILLVSQPNIQISSVSPGNQIHQIVQTQPAPSKVSVDVLVQAANKLFENPKSLGAIAIGHAEGNYDVDGNPEGYYYGHPDPGNGVHNQGFCSDQGRGGGDVAKADIACLNYNKNNFPKLFKTFKGKTPTIFEFLVVQDLHNQAHPRHAEMFPKKLEELREKYKDKDPVEFLANVRTETFWVGGKNTATGLLRACGLSPGSSVPDQRSCVYKDQLRRVQAIARVLQHHKISLTALLVAQTTQPQQKFILPVKGDFKVTSPFGDRDNPFIPGYQKEEHHGIDFAAAKNTPIVAVADGEVTHAGDADDGLGLSVAIRHPDGRETVYGHASKLHVRNGNRVKQGQKIADVGSTGNSTGPHLHFEVYQDETAINPASLLDLPAQQAPKIGAAKKGGVISPIAQKVVDEAMSRVGKHYRQGEPAQCAFFVRDVLRSVGIGDQVAVSNQPVDKAVQWNGPYSGRAQSFFGEDVGTIIRNKEDLQPGDLVAWKNTYGPFAEGSITHVGIYVGNDMVVDRSTKSAPVYHRSIDTFKKFAVGVRPHAYKH